MIFFIMLLLFFCLIFRINIYYTYNSLSTTNKPMKTSFPAKSRKSRQVNSRFINVKGIRTYSSYRNNRKNPVKVIIIKKGFLVVLKEKISKKSFWFSIITSVLLSLISRYLLQEYLHVNILEEMSNLSLSGVSYILFFIFFRLLLNVFFEWNFAEFGAGALYMDDVNPAGLNNLPGNNAPAGNNVPNHNWGDPNQVKAGKANGPMQVNDTSNKNYNYIAGGNNQPLLSNIGKGLEDQYSIGNSTLSAFMFTPEQEQFILLHLLHTNRPVYNRIMGMGDNYSGTYTDKPKWWNQSNSKEFRQNFR